jgi:hypothetical protein
MDLDNCDSRAGGYRAYRSERSVDFGLREATPNGTAAIQGANWLAADACRQRSARDLEAADNKRFRRCGERRCPADRVLVVPEVLPSGEGGNCHGRAEGHAGPVVVEVDVARRDAGRWIEAQRSGPTAIVSAGNAGVIDNVVVPLESACARGWAPPGRDYRTAAASYGVCVERVIEKVCGPSNLGMIFTEAAPAVSDDDVVMTG